MKVYELENEFLPDQKYAIEICYFIERHNESVVVEWKTEHFQIAAGNSHSFGNCIIQSVRASGSEIYIKIYQRKE